MEYFKDCPDEIEKILNSIDSERLRYVRIPKVKIRNSITRTQQTIKDIFIIAAGPYASKPYILESIVSGDKCYISHLDVTHCNVDGDCGRWVVDKYELYIKDFCNPVTQAHLWNRGKDVAPILAGNLMEQNKNDAYRTCSSVDIDKKVAPAHYIDTGLLIKSDATFTQYVTRCQDFNRTTIEQKRKLRVASSELRNNPDKCYCAYVEYKPNDSRVKEGVIPKSLLSQGNIFPCDYYQTYDSKDIDKEVDENECVQDVDVGCLGCGSATTQIVDQLSRLSYFQSYLLLDDDIIEAKNLRNQTYTRLDINDTKVVALRSIIQRVNGASQIFLARTRIENYPDIINMRFKYLISGFDNIEARKYVLEQIKSGKIKTKYLIDARYNSLDASLYMVDVTNKSELDYYEELLLSDEKLFKENEELSSRPIKELSDKDIISYLEEHQVFENNCSGMIQAMGLEGFSCSYGRCGAESCRKCWIEAIRESNTTLRVSYNSCVEQNIIHIYKLVSSWVTSNIVSIETDNKKLFSHVELTAQPLPKAIVIKK